LPKYTEKNKLLHLASSVEDEFIKHFTLPRLKACVQFHRHAIGLGRDLIPLEDEVMLPGAAGVSWLGGFPAC
jgi:hypothetical protein